MRVETTVDAEGRSHLHYIAEPGEHVLVTGPISGIKTLEDGTAVDVTPHAIVVADQAQADEVAHLIAMHHVENGHPHDIEVLTDPDTGAQVPVQRPFVYEQPDGFEPKPDVDGNPIVKYVTHVGCGIAHGDHPLDEANGITSLDADPRIAQVAAQTKED